MKKITAGEGCVKHQRSLDEFEEHCPDCTSDLLRKKKSQSVVRIEVRGGVAEVKKCPKNVFVHIVDYD